MVGPRTLGPRALRTRLLGSARRPRVRALILDHPFLPTPSVPRVTGYITVREVKDIFWVGGDGEHVCGRLTSPSQVPAYAHLLATDITRSLAPVGDYARGRAPGSSPCLRPACICGTRARAPPAPVAHARALRPEARARPPPPSPETSRYHDFTIYRDFVIS